MPDKNPDDLTKAGLDLNNVVEDERKRKAAQDDFASSADWADTGDLVEIAGTMLDSAVDAAKDAAEGVGEVVADIVSGILDS